MKLSRHVIACLLAGGFVCAPWLHAETYFVDSVHGIDSHSGKSDAAAWKTLRQVNVTVFQPGDRILFKCGSEWHEQLAPLSSGSDGKPIVLDSYGQNLSSASSMPHIFGDGVHADAVLLHNIQYVELHHLEISNAGDGHSDRRGVYLSLENFGTARHIVLADLYVHDVRGMDTKNNGGIIYNSLGDKVPSRFDGLLLEHNIVWKVDRSGIFGGSYHVMRNHWFPSLQVVFRENYVDDTGGDCIVPLATDGALVEGNVARRCNQRSGDYNAGIWQWGTDNTVLRLNEAFEVGGTKDGEGFDSDYNSRNTLFEFNYGHDNAGGFMLICSPGERENDAIFGNTGTVVRYNIARNNRTRLINLSAASDVLVEHNAFDVTGGFDVEMLVSNWKGWAHDARFRDNVFNVQNGTLRFGHSTTGHDNGIFDVASGFAPAEGIVYTGNQYIGKVVDAPADQPSAFAKALALRPQPVLSPEPFFDPAQPQAYPAYLKAHRAWMLQLFEQQFGSEVISRLRQ